MAFMTILILCLAMMYIIAILFLLRGLDKLEPITGNPDQPRVTVIVAARNEKDTIAECIDSLLHQTYPPEKTEIIIIDDHSDDGTTAIIADYARQHPVIRMISPLPLQHGISPKKQAVQAGIARSSGEWILTTDADCTVPPDWIANMMDATGPRTAFLASWLEVTPNGRLLGRLESLESLALVLIGAAAFGLKKPVIANAANMAYRRDVYDAVGGFSGGEHLGSGDDDLLMQKIAAHDGYDLRFVPKTSNRVKTPANHDFAGFLRQRVRWASKSSVYSPRLVMLLLVVVVFYLLALPGFILTVCGILPGIAWLLLPIKLLCDGLFMYKGCRMLERKLDLKDFLLTELLQLCYLPVVAVAGKLGRFQWKGRRYRQGVLQQTV